eukprot:586385-Rhodomonas_salina.1
MQIPELRVTGKMKTRAEDDIAFMQPTQIPLLSREAEVRGSARNLFAPGALGCGQDVLVRSARLTCRVGVGGAADVSSVTGASSATNGASELSAEWRTPRAMGRSLTDVTVVLYIREMAADIGEATMDSILEIQRAMSSEITMLLQVQLLFQTWLSLAMSRGVGPGEDFGQHVDSRMWGRQDAERNAESIKHRFRKRSAKGVQFHFVTTFMLEGIRLRAQAPNAALLLDSGSVVMQVGAFRAALSSHASALQPDANALSTWQVEGRPKGSIQQRAQHLHWKLSLE